MKDWYLAQSPRDRLIVVAVGVIALVSLLYALLWYPLSSRLSSTRQAIASKTETLEFLREGAARLAVNGGASGGGQRLDSEKPPYLLIDEVVRKAGVRQPDKTEPAGDNGARVQFSEVEFDKLVTVIAELEQYGLSITTLTLTKRKPGTVSARFNMEKS